MAYPTTGSTLNSKISTGLSTQIVVKVNAVTIGAIQTLTIDQTRPTRVVGEVGLDGILEIVPNAPTTYKADINRIVFDRLRLTEAFARGFINIKSQTVPFDIVIIDRTSGEDDSAIIHQLVNCWFTSYKPEFKASDYILSEQAGIVFEDIRTTLGNSAESAVTGGARGISFQRNAREQQTDAGSYRGSLDVSDLINQTFES